MQNVELNINGIASLANRLDALVVSIQHVDVDDTDELEDFCVRLESL